MLWSVVLNDNYMSDSHIEYIEKGKGETVVLLHGFCERKEVWNNTINYLSEVAHVIAPDLPGFGDNAALISSITIDRMAEQLHDWLHEQRIAKGLLVGHSLGGYVSLAFAEKYSEWMQGLGLFHSTALADTEERKQKRTQTISFIQKNGMEPFAAPFVRGLFYQPDHPHLKPEVDILIAMTAATPSSTAIEVTKAMRDRPDRTHILKKAVYPVLFIAGREDQAVPLSSLQEQFFLPHTTVNIQILPETNHMGMFEKKPESLAMLRSWVQQVIGKN